MTKETRPSPESASDRSELFPIGVVSERTGVNPITLRAWERRHRIIEPVRTESGHRLYSRDDVDLISRVVAMLDRGMRIGQVRAELEANARRSAGTLGGENDRWSRHRSRMVAAIIRFDEAALESVYNEAHSIHSVDVVTRELLTPLLVDLGERWKNGTGSVAEEHFFGFYLRNKLGARFHHRSGGNQGPRLIMACLPNEQHENGLLVLSLALHDRGYRLVLLGSNMPLEEIPAAARQAGCDAVVLSGSLNPDSEMLALRLPRVVAQTHVPVIIGGAASNRCRTAIQSAGAEPVGASLEQGIDRIEAILKARGENQASPSAAPEAAR